MREKIKEKKLLVGRLQSDFRSSLCHEFNRRDLVVVYVLGEPFGVERVSVVLL